MLDTKVTATELADIAVAKKLQRRLDFVYEPVPGFDCFPTCSACCFNSCEVRPIEYASILAHLRQMPQERKTDIIRKTVLFEFLHLVTLEHKCQFLLDGKCEVYPVRPLQCRFFGLYPDADYEDQQAESLTGNRELLRDFKRDVKIDLPAEVVTYDVEQCDAARQNGEHLVMPAQEREMTEGRLITLQTEAMPKDMVDVDDAEGGIHARFSYLFCASAMSETDMMRLRVNAMKEYQESGTYEVLETWLAMGAFDII